MSTSEPVYVTSGLVRLTKPQLIGTLDNMQGDWDCGLERVGRDCYAPSEESKSRKELSHDNTEGSTYRMPIPMASLSASARV